MATQLFHPPFGSPAWFHACVAAAQVEPVTHVVDVTPALAKVMLDNNPDNRSIRTQKMAQYASDMGNGKWVFNGEPLIVSRDGKLNDGQHRCMAAIDANATFKTLIVFGLDRDTRVTVDQGGARSASDYLGMEGVPHAALQSAIARMVIGFERTNGKGLGNTGAISNTEIMSRVHADPKIAAAAKFASTEATYCRTFIVGSLVGVAYYVLSASHEGDARTFLTRMSRGDGLKIKDPAHTLREKLIARSDSARDRRLALIFKAWNFHRRDMKVALASLNGEPPFPAIM